MTECQQPERLLRGAAGSGVEHEQPPAVDRGQDLGGEIERAGCRVVEPALAAGIDPHVVVSPQPGELGAVRAQVGHESGQVRRGGVGAGDGTQVRDAVRGDLRPRQEHVPGLRMGEHIPDQVAPRDRPPDESGHEPGTLGVVPEDRAERVQDVGRGWPYEVQQSQQAGPDGTGNGAAARVRQAVARVRQALP